METQKRHQLLLGYFKHSSTEIHYEVSVFCLEVMRVEEGELFNGCLKFATILGPGIVNQ